MKINKHSIIFEPDEILRKISQPVTFPLSQEQRETYQNMLDYVVYTLDLDVEDDTIDELPAVGLAAVQVGLLERMFAICIPADEENDIEAFEHIMINPEIVDHGDEFESGEEDCLSVLDVHYGNVWRYEWVRVKWYDLDGNQHSKMLTGFIAVVFQHEFDHLDGIMYYDRIREEKEEMSA